MWTSQTRRPQNYGKISRNNFQADLLQNNLFVRSASIRFDKINCLDHVGSPFRVRSKLVNTSVSRVWIPSDVNAQVWVAQSALRFRGYRSISADTDAPLQTVPDGIPSVPMPGWLHSVFR